jgi:hypothetical protein
VCGWGVKGRGDEAKEGGRRKKKKKKKKRRSE